MSDCLFCRIVAGEVPAAVVYRDETVTAFRDINPQAVVHVLLVPNEHIASTNDLVPGQDALVGYLVRAAAQVADQQGVSTSGYRMVVNCGPHAGQLVQHIHVHVLGGREMGWPPG